MKSIPNLSMAQIYPALVAGINLNTCHDPDCGNHGVTADASAPRVIGRNATRRKAQLRSNSATVGLGVYNLNGTAGREYRRTSSAFEYEADPHAWMDRKLAECQFDEGRGPCGAHFELLSNAHLADEIERLRGANGIFGGPTCKACGADYLGAPHEFTLDGAEVRTERRQRSPRSPSRESPHDARTPDRVRLIHKPCRGQPGARISATLDHRRHRRTTDNVAILMALVNGAGISDIMRMMAPSGSGRACGAKRVYDRIFWLERTLLAFERAQLAQWKARLEASGEPVRHHLAHDDVVLSVNWETSEDRRLTQLNCSATADVRLGYVFRLDVDFDPTVDPVSFVERCYVDDAGKPANLRAAYEQASGLRFTAPLMSFQRPSGRFEEHHLFAAAAHRLRLFCDAVLTRMPAATPKEAADKAAAIADLERRMAMIDAVHHRYFDVWESERDYGATFNGIMTRDVYTKAAHFAVLRELLPRGSIRLITEQEAMLPRILPHVFAEEIADEAFRWIAVAFDKEVKKPVMQARVAAFQSDFTGFVEDLKAADPAAEAAMTNGQRLRAYIAARLEPAHGVTRTGLKVPFPGSNFQQPFMPLIWVRSPIQTAGESNKVVGFPLMREARRRELKSMTFMDPITDPDTRAALAHHVWSATLQPVSTFFNSLRERLSFAQRAGGRSARTGPSYVNGAAYSPRVLIAALNIFRIYYNWFECRQYVAPWLEDGGADDVEPSIVETRIPGTNRTIPLATRRNRRPTMRTPAMRLGVQEERRDKNGRLIVPSLHRVLYRPWLFWGTPVWDKFENPKVDRRGTRYGEAGGGRAATRAPANRSSSTGSAADDPHGMIKSTGGAESCS